VHKWMAGLLLAGCSGGEGEETVEYHPSLEFLDPQDQASVVAGDLQVSVVVEDFELTGPAAGAAVAPSVPVLWLAPAVAFAHDGEGLPSGYVELRLDGAVVATMDSTQATIQVAVGTHTLEGELRYADGDALEEPVVATISISAE